MDIIQKALAKARAEREAQLADEAPTSVVPGETVSPPEPLPLELPDATALSDDEPARADDVSTQPSGTYRDDRFEEPVSEHHLANDPQDKLVDAERGDNATPSPPVQVQPAEVSGADEPISRSFAEAPAPEFVPSERAKATPPAPEPAAPQEDVSGTPADTGEDAHQKERETFIAPAPREQKSKGPTNAKATAPDVIPLHPVIDELDAAWQAVEPFVISPAHMESNRIVALQEGRAGSEFDMLRTRVLQQMRANNWRRLAITSPTPSCGKSTIALNLAFAICRQPNLRTVLLEMDLRRPSLAAALGVTLGHKFAHVLAGREPFSQHALRHGNNLLIATNRSPAKRSAELLQAPEASRALKDVEATYRPDFMIMDMPPMLVSDDTIAFMEQVDCVLLVAAAETTTVKEVDMCERELSQHTNVMGVVLNKCRHMGPEDGYGYYA